MQNSQDLALELTFPDEAFEIIPPPAKQCRICLSEEQNYAATDFLQPCICSGSMKYVHFKCLSNWIQRSQPTLLRKIGEQNYYSCEMCKYKIHFDCSDHYQCNTTQELKKKISVRKILFAVLIILTVICLGLSIAVSAVLAGQIGAPQSSFSTIILAITLVILTCLLVVLFYIWISDYFLSRSLFISKIHNFTFNNRRKKRSMSPQRTEDTLMTKTNKSACSRITIHPEIILNTSII